jgi:hypothetical protein
MTEDHASEYWWCAFKTYFQGVTNKLKWVRGQIKIPMLFAGRTTFEWVAI